MSLPDDLIQHALYLVGPPFEDSHQAVGTVHLRRAVSASYYALFHLLCEASVRQLAAGLSNSAAERIYRLLNHVDVKQVCLDFSKRELPQSLRDLLGSNISAEMQRFATNLIKLQEARHAADYDPTYEIDQRQSMELISAAMIAIEIWKRIEHKSEARIFILYCLKRNLNTERK